MKVDLLDIVIKRVTILIFSVAMVRRVISKNQPSPPVPETSSKPPTSQLNGLQENGIIRWWDSPFRDQADARWAGRSGSREKRGFPPQSPRTISRQNWWEPLHELGLRFRRVQPGLVTNSILFCWLFTIKDLCNKVCFLQTHNQGCFFARVLGGNLRHIASKTLRFFFKS